MESTRSSQRFCYLLSCSLYELEHFTSLSLSLFLQQLRATKWTDTLYALCQNLTVIGNDLTLLALGRCEIGLTTSYICFGDCTLWEVKAFLVLLCACCVWRVTLHKGRGSVWHVNIKIKHRGQIRRLFNPIIPQAGVQALLQENTGSSVHCTAAFLSSHILCVFTVISSLLKQPTFLLCSLKYL